VSNRPRAAADRTVSKTVTFGNFLRRGVPPPGVPYVCTGCGTDDDEHDPPCDECGSDSFVRVVGGSEGGVGEGGTARWRCRSCGWLHRRDRLSCENCAATDVVRVAVAPVADGGVTDAGTATRPDAAAAAAVAVRLVALGTAGLGAWLVADGRIGAGTALLLGGAFATPALRGTVTRRLGVELSDAEEALLSVLVLAVALGALVLRYGPP
jgi:hypothetical protein